MAGKLSYMKTCQEKFKRLENSPLGEALRQRTGLPSQRWAPHAFLHCCVYIHQVLLHSRFLCYPPALQVLSQNWVTLTLKHSSLCSSQLKPAARRATFQNHQPILGGQVTLGLQASTKAFFLNNVHQGDTPKFVFSSAESYAEEEEPRRKGILYEDLRLKNRENYEVMLSQKAETLHKASPEKETIRPNKEGEPLLLLRWIHPSTIGWFAVCFLLCYSEEHLWRHLGRMKFKCNTGKAQEDSTLVLWLCHCQVCHHQKI